MYVSYVTSSIATSSLLRQKSTLTIPSSTRSRPQHAPANIESSIIDPNEPDLVYRQNGFMAGLQVELSFYHFQDAAGTLTIAARVSEQPIDLQQLEQLMAGEEPSRMHAHSALEHHSLCQEAKRTP